MLLDRHENGEYCYDEGGTVYIGNAVKLSSQEIETLTALSGDASSIVKVRVED